jgi:hypothetical protein
MSRIRRKAGSVDSSGNSTPGRESSRPTDAQQQAASFVLSGPESVEMKRVLERVRQRVVDQLEEAPELRPEELLESMGCDDDVIQDLMVSPSAMNMRCGLIGRRRSGSRLEVSQG